MGSDTCSHGNDRDKCPRCAHLRRAARSVPWSGTRGTSTNNRRSSRAQCNRCGATVPRGRTLCDACTRAEQRNTARLARREERINAQRAHTPWHLDVALREWQAEALERWSAASHRGVVEAATGTGKTTLACAGIAMLHREHGDRLRVAVVVPTIALAKQWRGELERRLRLLRSTIGEQHSEEEIAWAPDMPILVTVLNTASERLPAVVSGWKTRGYKVLLIVDECHRAGSPNRARIFRSPFDFALGLSATPERPDEGEEEFVYPKVGGKIFEYPLLQALDDGVLSPLTALNLYVDFTPGEQTAWEKSSEDLSSALAGVRRSHPGLKVGSPRFFDQVSRLAAKGDKASGRLVGVLAARRALIVDSRERASCADKALKWIHASERRAIVFHESIASATKSYEFLTEMGAKAILEHSEMPQRSRSEAIDRFRTGSAKVLVTVRALDEGLDVPDAEIALIISGSRSHRQRIQRIGRILRTAEDKHARVITILVRGTPEEGAIGARDAARLGSQRVLHHRHTGSRSIGRLFKSGSTYEPDHTTLRGNSGSLTFRYLVSRQNSR